jgi:hypothetical protein
MILNILKYWKLIVIAFIAAASFCTVFGFWCYFQGQHSIYKKIADTPVETNTDWKQAAIQASQPVVKWLHPDTVYATPDEVFAIIDSLGTDIERYKSLLAEKAKPYSSKLDSSFTVLQQFADSTKKEISIPFSLSILSRPWSRDNKVEFRLEPFMLWYPEITKKQTLVKDAPWWKEPCSVIGTGLLVYGIAADNKTCGIIGGGMLVVRIIF